MNNIDNLHSLLEGGLTDAEEKNLYAELSSDSILRGEMRNILALNESVSSNRTMFLTSPSSKAAIFSSIGLTAGAVAPSLFSRIVSSKIFLSIASSILTTIAIFSIFNFGSSEETVLSNENQTPNYVKETIELALLPEQNFEENSDIVAYRSFANTSFAKPVSFANTLQGSGNQNGNQVQGNTIADKFDNVDYVSESKNITLNLAPKLNYTDNLGTLSARSYSFENTSFENQNNGYSKNEFSQLKSRFSLEWNTSESVHFPEERITPSQFATFHNNSISLLYDVNSRLTIGANARQETFYLVYKGIANNNLSTIYEQQPNLSSFSGLLRYDLFEVNKNMPYELETFTELQLGGNTLGPVGRIGIGLEFRPVRNITFVVAGQYSQLRFWHQNNGFQSEKFSLNYGVRFGF